MRHQIKEKRTRLMLRIELNRTCRLGSPDGERSRTDLSLRVLKMLANVAAIAGALAAIAEIPHRR
jgi:hypothetical protein